MNDQTVTSAEMEHIKRLDQEARERREKAREMRSNIARSALFARMSQYMESQGGQVLGGMDEDAAWAQLHDYRRTLVQWVREGDREWAMLPVGLDE